MVPLFGADDFEELKLSFIVNVVSEAIALLARDHVRLYMSSLLILSSYNLLYLSSLSSSLLIIAIIHYS